MHVVDSIETLVDNQNKIYETAIEQAKMRVSIDISRELFKDLIERVSLYVLRKIKKQYTLIKKTAKNSNKHSLRSCIKAFETTQDLSCAHTIEVRINALSERTGTLSLDDVHSH